MEFAIGFVVGCLFMCIVALLKVRQLNRKYKEEIALIELFH